MLTKSHLFFLVFWKQRFLAILYHFFRLLTIKLAAKKGTKIASFLALFEGKLKIFLVSTQRPAGIDTQVCRNLILSLCD